MPTIGDLYRYFNSLASLPGNLLAQKAPFVAESLPLPRTIPTINEMQHADDPVILKGMMPMGPGELPAKLRFVDFYKRMASEKSAGTGISMHPPETAKPVLAKIFAATHDDPDLAVKAISKIAPDAKHARFWLAQHLFQKGLVGTLTPAESVFLNTHMMGGK